jgi:acyl carrier protein
MAAQQLYERLNRHGLDYGPSFRGIEQIELADCEALGLVCRPEGSAAFAEPCRFPPTMLDACLQLLAAAISPAALQATGANAYLPVGMRTLRLYGAVSDRVWSHARIILPTDAAPQSLQADVRIFDESGEILAELLALRLEGFQSRVAARRTAKSPKPPVAEPLASAPAPTATFSKNGASAVDSLTRASLMSAPLGERQLLLEHHLHDRLAKVLELPKSAIDRHEPLLNLGLDSLMVFNLGTQLEVALGIQIEMQDLLVGPSVAELTSLLLAKLEGSA